MTDTTRVSCLVFTQHDLSKSFSLKQISYFRYSFGNFQLLYNRLKKCNFTNLFYEQNLINKNEYRTVCEPSHFP